MDVEKEDGDNEPSAILTRCPGRAVREATEIVQAAALATVRQVAAELTVRESMIFLDGREFTGEPPGCAPSSEAR